MAVSSSSGMPTVVPSTAVYHTWPSSDRMHFVPFGFVFPSYNVHTMWRLWFFGDNSLKICAFKHISVDHDLVTAKCKTNFSRCKNVMRTLLDIAVTGQKLKTIGTRITLRNTDVVFDFAFPLLVQRIYDGSKSPDRPQDINVNTIANRLYQQSRWDVNKQEKSCYYLLLPVGVTVIMNYYFNKRNTCCEHYKIHTLLCTVYSPGNT